MEKIKSKWGFYTVLTLLGILAIISFLTTNNILLTVISAILSIISLTILEEKSTLKKIIPFIITLIVASPLLINSLLVNDQLDVYIVENNIVDNIPQFRVNISYDQLGNTIYELRDVKKIYFFQKCDNNPILIFLEGDTDYTQKRVRMFYGLDEAAICQKNCTVYDFYLENTGNTDINNLEIYFKTSNINFRAKEVSPGISVSEAGGDTGRGGFLVKNSAELKRNSLESFSLISQEKISMSENCILNHKERKCNIHKNNIIIAGMNLSEGENAKMVLGPKEIYLPPTTKNKGQLWLLNPSTWIFEDRSEALTLFTPSENCTLE